MAHFAGTILTGIDATKLLNLTSEASKERPEGQSDSQSGDGMNFVKILDLNHVPRPKKSDFGASRKKICQDVGKTSRRDWCSNPRIDTKLAALPVTQRSYWIGPSTRGLVAEEIKRISKANITEPGTAEPAPPAKIMRKHDRLFSICKDFRKLSVVIDHATYLFAQFDGGIDCSEDAKRFSTLDANWGYCQMPVGRKIKTRQPFLNMKKGTSLPEYPLV